MMSYNFRVTSLLVLSPLLICSFSSSAASSYISLQDDYLNGRIEQLVSVSDMPVLKRPYSVKQVRNHLELIRDKVPGLYYEIDKGLLPYEKSGVIQRAEISLASAAEPDNKQILPNSRGETVSSVYRVSASAQYKHSDWIVVSAGGLVFDGEGGADDILPVDSYVAIGWDSFQLDFGYREHWLSPFSDSAMLMSTNARPSFSVGISNPVAFDGLWNLHYEVSVTRLEEHDTILYGDEVESGRPATLMTHLSIEPVKGWTIGANRTMQFGGGSREVSLSSIWDAFWDPVSNDNNASDGFDDCESEQKNLCEFGNQQASITTRLNFQGNTPFSIYGEYAGEDTASHSNWRLGNIAVSGGLSIPFLPDFLLGRDWSFTYEFTQWQNSWYNHYIYKNGYTNDGVGMGHWFANNRDDQDGVPGTANMVKLGWQRGYRDRYEFVYRQMKNDSNNSTKSYTTARELDIRYFGRWNDQDWGYRIYGGQTVYDDSFVRGEISLGW